MTQFEIEPAPSSRRSSASSRAVVILGGIVIAAVLAMTAYEIWRQRALIITAAERNLQNLSLVLAEETERSFHSVALVVEATATGVTAEGLANAPPGELDRDLKERTTGIPQVVGLAVIDAKGRVLASKQAFPPLDASTRDWFIHHRDNADPQLHIGVPAASPMDGQVVIPVSRRLSGKDGEFVGVVMAAVDPSYFEDTFSRVLPTDNGAAFALFRTDGILLARAPHAKGAVLGQAYPKLGNFLPGTPPAGVIRGSSPMDGSMRIVAFNTLAIYPVKINFSLDEAALLAPWRGNASRLTLAAILAAIVLASAVTALVMQLRREEGHTARWRESEQRLRFAQFALDNAADLVFWINNDGRILYANRSACLRLGYQADEIARLTITDIDPSVSVEIWRGHLGQLERDGQLRRESTHRTRNGETYPVEVAVTRVNFEGRDLACAFARDITERKEAEVALADKTARLEQSNAELEQFAYVSSHDLREPLRMVNSFVTMLARRYGDRLDDEAREYIAFAQDGAVRMDRLILDLLEYSRVGRLDRPLGPTPLTQALDLVSKGLPLAIADTKAQIDIPDDLPTVMANEDDLVRLYLNLLGNALKYHHPERPPHIRIGAERRGDEVLCWVADNGIGIAPQYFDRIFRIFQRLHGRDHYEGTGIGLAICKKIVERQGGRIWVEATLDQGSTFFFTLKAA